MVNFELFRIFKIVADEENLTRASNILHISQPAVTKHIKNLENQLNVKLFERNKYGMKLTSNGKKLYFFIKDSINTLNNVELLFEKSRNINIGIQVNIPDKIYSKCISQYYVNNKRSAINIYKLFTENMFRMLENQDVDIIFGKKCSTDIYDEKKIKYINLGYFNDVFLVKKDSKFLYNKIRLSDIKNEKIYTLKDISTDYINLKSLLKINKIKENNIENLTFSSIMEILKNDDIIAFIPKEYVEDKINSNELHVLDLGLNIDKIEFGIYYNVNNRFKELNKLINIFSANYNL